MTRSQIRENIFKLLFRVEFNPAEDMPEQLKLYFEDSFNDEDYVFEGAEIPGSDAEYIKSKYGLIIEKLDDIDGKINKSAKGWTVERIGKVELAILRLAIFEMIYDEEIPVSVAIDEAVDLAKKFGQDGASSFINGILAGIVRQNEQSE